MAMKRPSFCWTKSWNSLDPSDLKRKCDRMLYSKDMIFPIKECVKQFVPFIYIKV